MGFLGGGGGLWGSCGGLEALWIVWGGGMLGGGLWGCWRLMGVL